MIIRGQFIILFSLAVCGLVAACGTSEPTIANDNNYVPAAPDISMYMYIGAQAAISNFTRGWCQRQHKGQCCSPWSRRSKHLDCSGSYPGTVCRP